MARMVGRDNCHKGRETKPFFCTDLDKIIGKDTHLEWDLAPYDLFELLRSIRGEHLSSGRDCWEKIKKSFKEEDITETEGCGRYTTEDCFKKDPRPSTLHLLEKGLNQRTNTKFLSQTYLLVYTKENIDQYAHVDLSSSVFIPHEDLGFIMHLPLCSEGMWLRIWERDGVARKTSTGYFIHIPFGTVLFLRSDIAHSGIFGSKGNLRLHCAFQPESNPGDKLVLLPLAPNAKRHGLIGDLNEVVYARCAYPKPGDDDVELPIGADHYVEHFKEHFYAIDYLHHAHQRCNDPLGYAGLLPFLPESKKSPSSSGALKTSSNTMVSSSSSTVPPTLRKDPPSDLKVGSVAISGKKRKSSIAFKKKVPNARKKKKTLTQCDDAGITAGVKLEDFEEINEKVSNKTTTEGQEVVVSTDEYKSEYDSEIYDNSSASYSGDETTPGDETIPLRISNRKRKAKQKFSL